MQSIVKKLVGFVIKATDGNLGAVDEFYFDDQFWTVRYLVVETGSWLWDRRVLISTVALGKPDWRSRTFSVNLTVDQVRNSPNIDTNRPVCRQHEAELNRYYLWSSYWSEEYGGPPGGAPSPLLVASAPEPRSAGASDDPHLRSTNGVTGYRVHAVDGDIGHVADFLIDDDNWSIRFLEIDTGSWLPGRKVVMPPQWIQQIRWEDSTVHFDVSRELIRSGPIFNPSHPLSPEDEESLYAHYGRNLVHQ